MGVAKTIQETLQKKCLEAALLASVAGLALGALAPSTVTVLKALIPIAVFLMLLQPMYAMRLSALRTGLRAKLRFTLIVALLYTIVFPLYTAAYFYAASRLLPSSTLPMLAGAVLVALSPVAMPAPTFVALAGGDVEASVLSIVLTFLLSFVVIPLYAYLILHTALQVPVSKIIESLILYIAVPLAIGQTLRKIVEKTTGSAITAAHTRITRLLTTVSLTALYYVIFTSFAASEHLVAQHPFAALLLAISLFAYFAARFATAHIIGLSMRLGRGERIALLYAASGNGAIGIALSTPLGEAALTGAAIAGPLVLVVLMTAILRFLTAGHHKE